MTPTLTPLLTDWVVDPPLSTLFGLNSWQLMVAGMASIVLLSFFAYLASGSRLLFCYTTAIAAVANYVVFHTIPLWVALLFGGFASAFLLFGPSATTQHNPTSDSTNIITGFSWKRYGERMKRAYASKFGGDNKGFNEEVDARIAVMRTQGKGDTRTIAQEWLKRNAHFVEIPWKDLNDEVSKETGDEESHGI